MRHKEFTKEESRIEDRSRSNPAKVLRYSGSCVFCGDSYRANSAYAKYCSSRCSRDYQVMKRKEERLDKGRLLDQHKDL
jgi:hypothetical protein